LIEQAAKNSDDTIMTRPIIMHRVPKLATPFASKTPNSVSSLWISTKCRTLHCLDITDFVYIGVMFNRGLHCCYTSTQNTCTRLVQITSRDVHEYAVVTSSATTQWHSALHGGSIDNSALTKGIIWLASLSRRRCCCYC